MVTIQFAPTSLGRELAILNANRYMGAASVGVRMLEWEIRRHPEHGYPIGLHSHRHELLEISVVPVPANPDTLQAGIHGSSGVETELGRNQGLSEVEIAALGPRPVGADGHPALMGRAVSRPSLPNVFLPAHLACPSPPEVDRRVGIPPHPGRSPDPRVEPGRDLSGSAARLLEAIKFGLRGDQCQH
jgi:hypothetical protein